MSKRYSAYLPALVYMIDLILLNFSFFDSHFILLGKSQITNPELIFILLTNFSWSTVSVLSKSFKITRPLSLKSNLNKFISTLIYHLLLIFAVVELFNLPFISKYEIIITYSLFCVFVVIARSVLFLALDIFRKKGYNNRRVIVLGDRTVSERMIENIDNHPEYGYMIVDTIFTNELEKLSAMQLRTRLLSFEINEIYVCYKNLDQDFLNGLINFADSYLIKIKLVSDLLITNRYTELIDYDGIPAIQITSNQHTDHKIIFVKRIFDVVFSVIVMSIGLPLFFILYVVTKTSSKGTAFYKQERIGKNGKPFYIYKFRSMHANSEKATPQLSSDNDPRITKWGKIMRQTRLDELPQFWNVLKGEMSVVGPRPERQYFIEKIMERKPNYRQLLNIKPGITSIGQVSYGYAENIDQICDRINYDLPYLKDMTINKDLGIILKTVKVMVQRKGK